MDDQILRKINSFFGNYKLQTYKKGEILIRADDTPQGIFFLKEGTVKKYTISKKGEEIIVNIFKPSSFFPMSWAVNETENKYYYEAISELAIYRAPRKETVEFMLSNPDVVYDLLRRVYRGTDGIMSRMSALMSEDAYDRVVVELIIHAKRFGIQMSDNCSYEVNTSERDIASRSGLTRETVSREIKILKEKGLVTFNKSLLIIKNLENLEKELLQ